MAAAFARRGTLLIPLGGANNPDALHLHVILTDTCKAGLNLIGSISSIREHKHYDRVCEINEGEHPFIKHPSYFLYAKLQTVKAAHIETCIEGSVFIEKEPINEDLYQRICAGIKVSIFAPRGMKNYWDTNKPK